MITLSLNENPRGPSQRALDAMLAASSSIHRYQNEHDLLRQIADHHTFQPENIILGNGSSEVLDLIARTYLAPGDESLMHEHSFMVYKSVSEMAGATVIETKAKDYAYDLAALKATITDRTRVVWIDNPNNPTGTFIPHAQLKEFISALPSQLIIVLDEAYWDYLTDSERTDTIAWIKEFPNLIVTRTFSKLHGLAGLRIGYCVTSLSAAKDLEQTRQPFTVNALALAAASASLADTGHIAAERHANQLAIKQLTAGLDRLSIHYITPHANFITIHTNGDALLYRRLLKEGIATRQVANYNLKNHLRITTGTPEQNQQLLIALAKEIAQ